MPIGRPKGSRNKTTSKTIKSATQYKKEKKLSAPSTDIEEERKYYCTSCGKSYTRQQHNFRYSNSPFWKGNNGYIPICVKCIDHYEEQYIELLGSPEAAIQRMCLHFDLYFNQTILESTKKVSNSQSRIGSYVSKCGLTQYNGKTYDTYLKELENDKINSIEDLQEAKEESDISITERTVKAWGFGFSPEDYEFLNMQFSDWKARVVVDGKSRESLVRELCIIKLQINKALQSNNVDLYNKLLVTYQKLLDSANLSPKQEDANDKAGEKPMGVMIEMFENERPIPSPKEEWINNSMIKLITIYFIGHLAKMMGIKNKYFQMYENEMNKYRVEIPELENSDDDEIFDFLINDNDEKINNNEIDLDSIASDNNG